MSAPAIAESAVVPMPTFTGTEPCKLRPDGFFLAKYTRSPEVRAAKEACHTCPLMPQCQVWALANPHLTPYGIWGATTPSERRTFRSRLARRLTDQQIKAGYRTAYDKATKGSS